MDLAGLFNPIASIVESVTGALGDWFKTEDDKVKAKAAITMALQQAAAVQAMVTLAEAQSESKFKSWWRPGLGWTCALGLFLHAVFFPVLVAALAAFGHELRPPTIDVSLLMGLITTLLGLGTMRTVEKSLGAE